MGETPRTSLLRSLLHGPLPALPAVVDTAVEGWWRLPPRVRALALVVLGALVVFGITSHTSASPHGPTRMVVVARADATAGEPVSTADVAVLGRPAAFVPDGALEAIPDGRLARDLGAGEVVTSRHVVDDLHGLLRPGEVAIAVDHHVPPLPARADLQVLGTAFDGSGRHLADARLLAADPEWTWIAVAAGTAPDIAAALATGGVTLAIAGADG